ncbi:MAG: DUF2892 domain-containing protein [Burkholderiales bacterium]|nr:DUF2892 domain-containing protein [Burkholderiales bacterium]
MPANLGSFDRLIRVLSGLALLCMAVLLQGAERWWGAVGLLPLASGLAGWCPVCAVLDISTRDDSDFTQQT